MKKLLITYFGTPYFSALFLEKMITDILINQLIEVRLVVTQPDKPVGRKQIMTSNPVKELSEKAKIPVTKNTVSSFLKTIDLVLVFAYGQIIPKELLDIPKYGFWCIHPSLLPQYRGPSPITYPLIFGDKKTGVTIFKMDEKIDHGPIITQEEIPISPNDKRPDLEIKLTDLAFQMFSKLINLLIHKSSNKLIFSQQEHKNATFTRMLEKKDGFIPFPILQKALKNEPLTFEEIPTLIKNYLDNNRQLIENFKLKIKNSPEIIFNLFRGLYPWPGIWTLIKINGKEKRLKIIELSLWPKPYSLIPICVQLEGKKEVYFDTFNEAYKIFTL